MKDCPDCRLRESFEKKKKENRLMLKGFLLVIILIFILGFLIGSLVCLK